MVLLSREFIAVPDDKKKQIVFKWPDVRIRKFTRAIVDADEMALFVNTGQVVGTMGPGRHQIDAQELPFLGMFIDAATGGNAYRSELYFVGTREYPGFAFGGRIDDVQDPQTGMIVTLRVFGDYSLQVKDPAALITNLVGTVDVTNNETVAGWVSDQLLKVMRTEVTRQIVRNGWPILGLSAYTPDIEKAIIEAGNNQLVTYGVALVRMGNFDVNLSEQDEAQLKNLAKDTAYSRLAGGFNQYAAGEMALGAGAGHGQGRRQRLAGSSWPQGSGSGASLVAERGGAAARPGPTPRTWFCGWRRRLCRRRPGPRWQPPRRLPHLRSPAPAAKVPRQPGRSSARRAVQRCRLLPGIATPAASTTLPGHASAPSAANRSALSRSIAPLAVPRLGRARASARPAGQPSHPPRQRPRHPRHLLPLQPPRVGASPDRRPRGGPPIFYGGGSIGFIVFIVVISIMMRSMRGGSGGGPWGRGPWGRGLGGGPTAVDGEVLLVGREAASQAAPRQLAVARGRRRGRTRRRGGRLGPAVEAGGGPAGGGWASGGAGGDAGVPVSGGHGAGGHLSGSGGMWPGDGTGDWMNDNRPASASIPGELFPEAHARAMQAASPVDVGLAAIKAHDPGFELEQFTQQVQRVFFIVETAWSERKPETSRQVMADALWLEQRQQVQGYIDGHKRNMLDNLTVSNIWPVAAHSDNRWDTITVRVMAASADYDVDDQGGRVLRGDREVKSWAEDWTFQRSSKAQTKDGGTGLGSKCPNCGAPLDVDLAGICRLLQGEHHVGGL